MFQPTTNKCWLNDVWPIDFKPNDVVSVRANVRKEKMLIYLLQVSPMYDLSAEYSRVMFY